MFTGRNSFVYDPSYSSWYSPLLNRPAVHHCDNITTKEERERGKGEERGEKKGREGREGREKRIKKEL